MILKLSIAFICVTVVIGIVLTLALGVQRLSGTRLAGPVHGTLGATGLVLLLVALRAPARGAAYGTGGFGTIAAVLLGLAIVAGLLVGRVVRRRRRDPFLAIGLHAMLAISALALLAAYVSLPA